MAIDVPKTIDEWNARGAGHLPGHLQLQMLKVEANEVIARLQVTEKHMTWHGFLHAGTAVSLADTCCGYGALCALPDGAESFSTVDLSSSHVGTAREGNIICTAKPVHLGRTTQVWEASVTRDNDHRMISKFRCTQLILWPRR